MPVDEFCAERVAPIVISGKQNAAVIALLGGNDQGSAGCCWLQEERAQKGDCNKCPRTNLHFSSDLQLPQISVGLSATPKPNLIFVPIG